MSAGLVIDLCLLIVAAYIIIKFTVKGFVSSILDASKLVLSVFISFIVRVPVARFFCSLFMDRVMFGAVESSLEAYLESDTAKITIDITSLAKNTPEFFEKLLTKFELDYPLFISDLDKLIEDKSPEVIPSLAENIGGACAFLISIAIALIVVFIIAFAALSLLSKLLSKITEFDGVKSANKWLGALIGVILSVIIMWGVTEGLLALTAFVDPLSGGKIEEIINGSMVVGIFKHISIIDIIKNKIYG
ncbi:MAG: CvpA family protein [Clostridia bacterium]|nr:CvpA family protein [Clostridia bacterium]